MKVEIKTKPAVTEKVVLEMSSRYELDQLIALLVYADRYIELMNPCTCVEIIRPDHTVEYTPKITMSVYREYKELLTSLRQSLRWP